MSVVLQVLVAAALIAVMILVRVIANRYAVRQKLNCSHADNECHTSDCSERSEAKRSACHAP